MMSSTKKHISTICAGILICFLVASNALTLNLYLHTFDVDENELVENTGDEIARAKFFIVDWYKELSEQFELLDIKFNEVRFIGNGKIYTLTIAADRIRATYPRGVRYFQMQYISYIEILQEPEHIQGKMYYNKTGEYKFVID